MIHHINYRKRWFIMYCRPLQTTNSGYFQQLAWGVICSSGASCIFNNCITEITSSFVSEIQQETIMWVTLHKRTLDFKEINPWILKGAGGGCFSRFLLEILRDFFFFSNQQMEEIYWLDRTDFIRIEVKLNVLNQLMSFYLLLCVLKRRRDNGLINFSSE